MLFEIVVFFEMTGIDKDRKGNRIRFIFIMMLMIE